jgi:hypothetical protein
VVTNSIASRAASVLPVVGIPLAAVNWYVRPQAAAAWAAAIVMLAIMVAVLHRSKLAIRRPLTDTRLLRSFASIRDAVVFGALMIIIPLGITLARSFGVVSDPDSGQRVTMMMLGLVLVVQGNAMPRMLPPLSSMPCDGARVQAFQRFAGWTWVICGLGFATAWLVLPSDAAQPVSVSLIAGAVLVTVVQILRLRRTRQPASGH